MGQAGSHGVQPGRRKVAGLLGEGVVQRAVEGEQVHIVHGDVVVLALGLRWSGHHPIGRTMTKPTLSRAPRLKRYESAWLITKIVKATPCHGH